MNIPDEIRTKLLGVCPICHMQHELRHFSYLEEEQKKNLKDTECHLNFQGYQGSFIENNRMVDVYS
jgi:hypothetical protein